MERLVTNLYNTSMKIGQSVVEMGQTLNETDKDAIMDSVGALLSALGVAKFYGVYTIEDLKRDIREV